MPYDPLLGCSLDNAYTIHRLLAEGASGRVYIAQRAGERLVVKVLKVELQDDAESLERFRREIVATQSITHPLAVQVYGYGYLENLRPWVAMELIEGPSLDAYLLQRGPLEEDALLALLRPLCEILQEAHGRGIVHRDLKAHHILLPTQGGQTAPRIIDFGLAKLSGGESLTGSGLIAGSPEYMAPEQWEGLDKADARSDLYSLGMIAYQCLSGRLPFEANTLLDWMRKHHHEAPKPLSARVRPSLAGAIMRSISKRPEDRQPNVAQFWSELTCPEP